MCSTGQCGWCECAVDGQPSVRTCEVPVGEGLDVRGEHAWPSVERDIFQLLGVGSRFVPPTFYHHRFLRPKALRKRYLDVIRGFGGRGRLRPGPRHALAARTLRTDTPDVLVIGAGRGGLLAATAAAAAGARVVVLERGDAGAEAGLVEAARAAGVEVRVATAATGWYDGLVTAHGAGTAWELRAGAVVAAMGTYELVPSVPGADRPGVIGARRVRELIGRHLVLPGDRALCVGSGPDLEAVRVALTDAGAEVVGHVPTDRLVRIGGRRAVTWADHRRDDGKRRRVSVDLVVFGDRTPNLDLVLAAGGAVGWRDDGRLRAVTGPDGATSVPGLWVAAGDDGDDLCRAAGTAAARHRAEGSGPRVAAGRTALGEPARATLAGSTTPAGHVHGEAVLCFCEDVRAWEIRAEQRDGYTDPELVKRRTGALTGPCQGKYCLAAVTCAVATSGTARPGASDALDLPTARPPLVPTRLGDLVAIPPADEHRPP
jgi:sarcosine oxidase subunit alpha